MNTVDCIITLVIAAIVILSVRSIIIKKKRGGCCGDCSKCSRPHSDSCKEKK